MQHLSEGLNSSSQEEDPVLQFKQDEKIVLSLGKKEFSHSDHQEIFTLNDGDWVNNNLYNL